MAVDRSWLDCCRGCWFHLLVNGKGVTASASRASDQILPGDDFTKSRVIGNELLDELVHAALENVIHVRMLQPVADTAGMALRRSLPPIGNPDLVEIADEIAIAARQRPRQRVVEDQEIRDQPWLQGLAIDPVIGGQRRDRAQDRGPLVEVERTADMLL